MSLLPLGDAFFYFFLFSPSTSSCRSSLSKISPGLPVVNGVSPPPHCASVEYGNAIFKTSSQFHLPHISIPTTPFPRLHTPQPCQRLQPTTNQPRTPSVTSNPFPGANASSPKSPFSASSFPTAPRYPAQNPISCARRSIPRKR